MLIETGSRDLKDEKIISNDFDCFKLYSLENAYSFVHIKINEPEMFYKDLFEYFFQEDNLIQYIKNQKGIYFKPTTKQYVTLYKHLQNYIDLENLENIKLPITTEPDFNDVILEEMHPTIENNNYVIRNDKFGKIGEYLFSVFLSKYFKFDCIIPKVHFTTDNNMSVYGIDTLFYSSQQNLLLFGESKFCTKLQNGITLINHSLKEYQQQISEEFRLVLSGGFKENCSKIFNEKFGSLRDLSLKMEDFIKNANIQKLGIPIFIAHGNEIDEKQILNKLKKIQTLKFFDLDTIYYFISLPIINKNDLMNLFISQIKEKVEFYSNAAK